MFQFSDRFTYESKLLPLKYGLGLGFFGFRCGIRVKIFSRARVTVDDFVKI